MKMARGSRCGVQYTSDHVFNINDESVLISDFQMLAGMPISPSSYIKFKNLVSEFCSLPSLNTVDQILKFLALLQDPSRS